MTSLQPVLILMIMASLKVAILLATAGLLSVALKNGPAKARLMIWTAALLGALALPWLGAAIPTDWRPRISFPTVRSEEGRSVDAGSPGRVPAPVGEMGTGTSADSATPKRIDTDLTSAAPLPWTGIVLLAWLLPVAGILLRFTVSSFRIRRLSRQAVDLNSGEWRDALTRATRLAGVDRPVRLVSSPDATTPMTWGAIRPVIMIPWSATEWAWERMQLVLLHECIHIRRNDWLIRRLGSLACAVYWFNPLVWLAAAQIALEQEFACDDEVLASGTVPSSYAGHLLAIARASSIPNHSPVAALDMARRSGLEVRLMSILNQARQRRSLFVLPALILIATLIPLLAAVDRGSSSRTVEEIKEDIRVVKEELQPFEEQLEVVESRLKPFEDRLSEVEIPMEALELEMEGLEELLAPVEERIADLELDMEPLEQEMKELQKLLEPLELEIEALEMELEPLDESDLEQLAPVMEKVEEVLARMQPTLAAIAEVQVRSLPVQELMADVMEEMQPEIERITEHQLQFGPHMQRIQEVQEEMQPVLQDMQRIMEEAAPLFRKLNLLEEELEEVRESAEVL